MHTWRMPLMTGMRTKSEPQRMRMVTEYVLLSGHYTPLMVMRMFSDGHRTFVAKVGNNR